MAAEKESARSSITISRNAKGDPSYSVKVYAENADDAPLDLMAEAVETFEALTTRYHPDLSIPAPDSE